MVRGEWPVGVVVRKIIGKSAHKLGESGSLSRWAGRRDGKIRSTESEVQGAGSKVCGKIRMRNIRLSNFDNRLNLFNYNLSNLYHYEKIILFNGRHDGVVVCGMSEAGG